MDEKEILRRISGLVDEEHQLRAGVASGQVSNEDERARLQDLEVALDQCWDLLRQRRARLDAGENPDLAAPRPEGEVEGYLQ
jgi:hypothetical protein